MKHWIHPIILVALLPLVAVSCSTDGASEPVDEDPQQVRFGDFGHESEGSLVLHESELDRLDVVSSTLAAGFKSVGLRWDRIGAELPNLTARARVTGGTWSQWTPVSITWNEATAYNGAFEPEDGTANEFELRGAAGLTSFLVVELLPYERPAPQPFEQLVTKTSGLAPASLVNSRASWGAASTRCHPTNRAHTPLKISIHHTTSPTFDSLSVPARLRQIQDYHMNTNNWCDLGYHFLVSRDGRIWQGMPSETMRGVHVRNQNTNNVGVSFIGNFETHQPPQAAIDAGGRIVGWLATTYNIQLVTGSTLMGHRDQNSTLCPGQYLYSRLAEIRTLALGGGGSGGTEPPMSEGLCLGNGSLSCGTCANPIDIEADYLPGVVQCENGAAPPAALEAQAIAARSYLYYALETNGSIPDSQAGQVYSCGQVPSAKTRAAVQATRELVLNNSGGQTIAAFYVAGAIPAPPLCVGDSDDPDAFNTEQWVTYQQIAGGGGPSPLGHPGNPKNRGCMSQNGASCLASVGATYSTILETYYAGVSLINRAPTCGGSGQPPVTASCPNGNGLYCGGTVGLSSGFLYLCQGGAYTLTESCDAGCQSNPAGTADACVDPGPTCPDGNGTYCGASVGLDGNTLYLCTNGSFSAAASCSHGCSDAPGASDACSPPPPCPLGDGIYCGGPVGLNSAWLYDCAGGEFTLSSVCNNGCESMPAGTADACAPTPQPEPEPEPEPATCPLGDGVYCGGPIGLNSAWLYDCAAGEFTVKDVCDFGCESMPAGTADACAAPPVATACPLGDGIYCGGPVGLNNTWLYDCAAGEFTLNNVCEHGCESMPSGTADACAAVPEPAACPSGDGLYCGGPVGLNAASLYNCAAGEFTVTSVCEHGCQAAAPGTNDSCAPAPATCPSGDGLYCGSSVGLDATTLYGCAGGQFTASESCSHGCVTNGPGINDSCAPAPAACPNGNGSYCGSSVGLIADVLYGCSDGTYWQQDTCNHGCQVGGSGSDSCASAPNPTPACPEGDGNYCGGAVGLDAGRIYWCGGGTFVDLGPCTYGCQQVSGGSDNCAPEPIGCPNGDGTYCGGAVGLDPGRIYWCGNGSYANLGPCTHGCQQLGAGGAHACAPNP